MSISSPLYVIPSGVLEDELAAEVAATPPGRVERDLRLLHRDDVPPLLRGPHVLGRIVDALQGYWELCFTPYWPRMRALLEGDVKYGPLVSVV